MRAYKDHLGENMLMSLLPFPIKPMEITAGFQGLRRRCGSPHTYNDDRVQLLLGISPKAVRYKFTTCQERFFLEQRHRRCLLLPLPVTCPASCGTLQGGVRRMLTTGVSLSPPLLLGDVIGGCGLDLCVRP